VVEVEGVTNVAVPEEANKAAEGKLLYSCFAL